MTDYIIRLSSYYQHPLEVIHSILALPTLAQLIFPAILHTGIDRSILLSSGEQFSLALIPQELWMDSNDGFNFSLYGENGVELYTIIWKNPLPVPSTVGLRFKSEHLGEIIHLSTLKSLFEEIVPIFQVDIGAVYDKKTSRRTNPMYQDQRDMFKSSRHFQDSRGKKYTFGIHWINYFGKYVLDALGRDRFNKFHTYSEKYELHDGMMIILQDNPYDDDNPEHFQKQVQAETELYSINS